MPAGEWADIHVGDRVQVVYEDSELRGQYGTVVGADGWGARVLVDGCNENTGFSYRSSLKKLSNPTSKRPISPIFYTTKGPHHVMG